MAQHYMQLPTYLEQVHRHLSALHVDLEAAQLRQSEAAQLQQFDEYIKARDLQTRIKKKISLLGQQLIKGQETWTRLLKNYGQNLKTGVRSTITCIFEADSDKNTHCFFSSFFFSLYLLI